MRKLVLRYGLASGLALMAMSAVLMPLCLNGTTAFSSMSVVLGYATMVVAFVIVFFGVRSYRETIGGGAISFAKAFQVGLLMTLITCAMYVLAWEIMYFNFFPDFLEKYTAFTLAKMHAAGESEAAIQKTTAQLTEMAKHYHNVFYNSAITFMEVFPVGLVVALVTAAILRRKPGVGRPAPVPA